MKMPRDTVVKLNRNIMVKKVIKKATLADGIMAERAKGSNVPVFSAFHVYGYSNGPPPSLH